MQSNTEENVRAEKQMKYCRKQRHNGQRVLLSWKNIKPTLRYHILQRGIENKLRLWKVFSLKMCYAPSHEQTEEPESCPGSDRGRTTQLVQASHSPLVKQAWGSLQLCLPGLSAPLPFYSVSSCVLKAFIVRLPDTEPEKYMVYTGKNDPSYLLAESALTWGTELTGNRISKTGYFWGRKKNWFQSL